MLYNQNYGDMLLGCLMNNPDLLENPMYPLKPRDFSPVTFHKVLFGAVAKLAKQGAGRITEIEIDTFAKDYPENYEILNDSNFLEYVSTVSNLCNMESLDLYYNTIRKFSLLRDLKEQHIDISKFYDEMLDEESQNAKLNEFTIKDILNHYDNVFAKYRSEYDTAFVRNEMYAGENTKELIEYFKQAPAFGAFRSSPMLTQLFSGLNKGHLQMHSAPSGVGKTKISIMDLCFLSSKYLWDDEAEDFVENYNYCGPGLFIATEMNIEKEINPQFLACISGVELKKITLGKLTPEEEGRVVKAGDILNDTKQISIVDMPDFTSRTIEEKIKEKVENDGVENVVFDYLQLNSCLGEEYKARSGGVPAREDLVLRSLATDLKAYAEKYNVRMITSSQLNGHEKEVDFPDESCLSSAKSIKQKLDAGVIYLNSADRQKELKLVEPFVKRTGFGDNRTPLPNVIAYVYKARFGDYGDTKVKIFSWFDKGRMRFKDCICLDAYNNPVTIPIPKLTKQGVD